MGDISVLKQIISQQSPPAGDAGVTDAHPDLTVVPLAGSQMSRPEQAQAALSHAWHLATLRIRDLREREGGMLHSAYHGNPESLAELDEYRRSRAWVPVALRTPDPGEDEPLAGEVKVSFAEWEGALYYATIGRAGKAFCNWGSWTFERQFRFWLTLLTATILAIITVAWLA